jgi:quercetin dioxygenase-like cupin family protein
VADQPVFPAYDAERAAEHKPWGSLCWLASKARGNAEGLTLGRVVIKKGESNPKHSHPGCEEALYVLAGQLEHDLGTETYPMGPGDTIVIPPGVEHQARSVGDVDADMIVVYSSAERDFAPAAPDGAHE